MSPRIPTALGVHIFAGGFTTGVKQSGFNILAHLEEGNYGVSTARLNWPDLEIRVGKSNWQLPDFTGEVDFLYSNPPCAIFSTAGISTTRGRDAWKEDARLNCWYSAWDVFEKVKPKVFALESVCQAYSKGREVVDNFTKRAIKLGYSAQHIFMDSKWTGIPQSRKRFFLIFHRHWLPLELRFDYSDPPTVGEVLDEVTDPGIIHRHDTGANFAQWIKKTLPGEKLREAFDRENPHTNKSRPGFMYTRLHPEKQMGAFVGILYAHPHEPRFIGLNEAKALCGYPDDFALVNKESKTAISLLARAVLPSVGRWLSTAVRKVSNLPKRTSSRPIVIFADLRKPPPSYLNITDQYITYSKPRTNLVNLSCAAKSCDLCPRMRGKTRVLSQSNGPINTDIMFIGEAPGRNGADITGLPFYGDAAGANFESLLKSIGLDYSDVFVTNAILCNPTLNGKNDPPNSYELVNCSKHLAKTIEVINPSLIASLGLNALTALNKLEKHNVTLANVGKPVKWFGRYLFPLYHTSPRAIITRSMNVQRKDFANLKRFLERIKNNV